MGFLTNLFKTKELIYLEQLYKETKEDKEQLKKDNELLRQQIDALNKQLIELLIKTPKQDYNYNNSYENNNKVQDIEPKPIKLEPKERFILELVEKYKNYDEVLKRVGMKEQSFKVYISKIRGKKYPIIFETDEKELNL
jgi:hypothetical protein